jgi:RNA polymerase sigma-70 factor (ECF subfamily)
MYCTHTDQELVALLNQGDKAAYTEIYNRYFALLYIYALKKLNDRDDAKDAVQHVFIALWNRHQSISFDVSLSAYLYRAVRNFSLTTFAHKQVEDQYLRTAAAKVRIFYEGTDYMIREKDIAELIEKEISRLPLKMREIFLLSRQEGLTYKQIAETLQISEETVNTQMKRALKMLRMRLGLILFVVVIHDAQVNDVDNKSVADISVKN